LVLLTVQMQKRVTRQMDAKRANKPDPEDGILDFVQMSGIGELPL